jgi:hypothetical protein
MISRTKQRGMEGSSRHYDPTAQSSKAAAWKQKLAEFEKAGK